MKKSFTLLTALLMTLIGTTLTAQVNTASVQMVLPADMVAGEAYDVEIKINKGTLDGFARFHQDLPLGFAAEEMPGNNEGAVFSFDDQRLRFIWASLPGQESFSVKYRLRVTEPRLQGRLQLVGRFTYVLGNERKTVDVESPITNITHATSIAKADAIDIEAFQKGAYQPGNTAASVANANIFAVRQRPHNVNGEWVVNIQVTKGNLTGLGQLEEEAGNATLGKIVNIESQGAITKINNNRITYAWMQLPPDSSFVVSYKIIPLAKQPAVANIPIQGLFTYNQDAIVTSIDVVERDVDFGGAANPQVKVLNQTFSEEVLPTAGPSGTTTMPKTKTAATTAPKVSMQKGLVFKVQVLATRQSIGDPNVQFAEFELTDPVVEEYSNDESGFAYKYVMGPFAKYEQAVAYRDKMWKKGIGDAFVTSYYNGRRISTQEALLIAQKKR